MRPKKKVLLYCADYDRRNDLAFVLRVRCTFALIDTFCDLEELAVELRGGNFGCVVLVTAGYGDRRWNGQRRDDSDDFVELEGFDEILADPKVSTRTIEVWPMGKTPRQSMAWKTVSAVNVAALAAAVKVGCERRKISKDSASARLVEVTA